MIHLYAHPEARRDTPNHPILSYVRLEHRAYTSSLRLKAKIFYHACTREAREREAADHNNSHSRDYRRAPASRVFLRHGVYLPIDRLLAVGRYCTRARGNEGECAPIPSMRKRLCVSARARMTERTRGRVKDRD